MCDLLELAQKKAQVYWDEAELWKRDHERAMLFFTLQDLVADGISAFRLLSNCELNWRRDVYRGSVAFDEATDEAIRAVYQKLHDVWERLTVLLHRMEQEYGQAEGRGEFLAIGEELRGMFTPDGEFFVGDAIIQLRDKAIAEHLEGGTSELCTGT